MRLPADSSGEAQVSLRGPRVLKPPDIIFLHGVRFQGHHGVTEEERATGGAFEVDVELFCAGGSAGIAALTDRIEHTIDYASVHREVLAVGRGPSCALVETLAERIADAMLARFSPLWVRVRVKKLAPPGMPDVHCAGVEIQRRLKSHKDTVSPEKME